MGQCPNSTARKSLLFRGWDSCKNRFLSQNVPKSSRQTLFLLPDSGTAHDWSKSAMAKRESYATVTDGTAVALGIDPAERARCHSPPNSGTIRTANCQRAREFLPLAGHNGRNNRSGLQYFLKE